MVRYVAVEMIYKPASTGVGMFTEIFAALKQGEIPDLKLLQRRFDLAMTKKLGVVKLPSAFWMQDPKINPRADHLLQAALLLGDRERCDLAMSVLAVEHLEQKNEQTLNQAVQQRAAELIEMLPTTQQEQIKILANSLVTEKINMGEERRNGCKKAPLNLKPSLP